MIIPRQLGTCFLLGVFWILCAVAFLLRPQVLTLVCPGVKSKDPIVWSWRIGGETYGFIQVNKGMNSAMFGGPGGMPDAAMEATHDRHVEIVSEDHRIHSDTPIAVGTRREYWVVKKGGALRTVAVLCIAGKGYLLPLCIEGFLMAIGISVIGLTSLMAYRINRNLNMTSSSLMKQK